MDLVERARTTPVDKLCATISLPLCYDARHPVCGSLPIALSLHAIETMPLFLFEWAFRLVKSNMEQLYREAADTGWSDGQKREEMREENGRYLIATARQNDSDIPIGFLFFTFVMEESNDGEDRELGEAPVVYCMELQLEPEYRGLGLGEHMMHLMEEVGRAATMRKAMLTVFKRNTRAVSFYYRIGYKPDAISPSESLPPIEAGYFSYEILCKVLR
ncbi:acyl-CoA N-acyltransferase [Zopfochytrium polystomum]|nr:acyl-CoA N-acyltransferase [Zopfochytrium polystomum]